MKQQQFVLPESLYSSEKFAILFQDLAVSIF